MKSTLTILFFSLLFLSGCSLFFDREPRETPAPTLPEITAEGANTFGCLVDGEVWLPESDNWSYVPVRGTFSNGSLLIDTNKIISDDTTFQGVTLKVIGLYKPDTFYLGFWERDFPVEASNASFVEFGNEFLDYQTQGMESSAEAGTVIITSIDTASTSSIRHVAGTFEFKGFNKETNQWISIEEGRFDVDLP